MEHFAAILIITALILAYASFMLFVRFRSEGMPAARVWRVIAELWGVFILIIGTFTLSDRLLGESPRNGLVGETADRWSLLLKLPPGQQALLGISILASLLLFLHLLWTMRAPRPARD
ncbi:MAG TPA: hypothetical protein VGM23_05120 [Armatimonadota bacterium]|jgi:hypothetical protein